MTAFLLAHLLLGVLALFPSYIKPDSVGTYSWLRSAVHDGDLLFYNEWETFGMIADGYPQYKEVTEQKTLANHWGVGTSLLASPIYLVTGALARLLDLSSQTAGFFGIYGFSLALASVLFAAMTLILLDDILASRGATGRERIVTVLVIWLGTSLFWYEYQLPLGTHAAGAFCISLLCWFMARCDWDRDEVVIGAGLAFGLAAATRIQHLAVFPALLLFLWSCTRRSRSTLIFGAAASLPLSVQALAWQIVYGSPLGPLTGGANLAGSTWAPLQRITFDSVLFSSYHGLISWSPIIGLCLVGWWMSYRHDRRLTLAFVLIFLLQLTANATMDRYFWGGMAFGARRFVDFVLPFGFGLWAFLRYVRAVSYPLAGLATLWSVSLMGSTIIGELDLLHDVSWSELVRAATNFRWVGDLELRMLNAPVAYPAAIPQFLLAVLAVLLVWGGVLLGLRRPRVLGLIVVGWVAASAVGLALMARPTRVGAERALEEYQIDLPLASVAGPLIDQRALLIHELAYYRRAGRESAAKKTIQELRAIDTILADQGLR